MVLIYGQTKRVAVLKLRKLFKIDNFTKRANNTAKSTVSRQSELYGLHHAMLRTKDGPELLDTIYFFRDLSTGPVGYTGNQEE